MVLIACIIGIVIGVFAERIIERRHEIYGGTIVIDLGVEANDTIKVEARSRLEDWMKADKIVFDKEVRG